MSLNLNNSMPLSPNSRPTVGVVDDPQSIELAMYHNRAYRFYNDLNLLHYVAVLQIKVYDTNT